MAAARKARRWNWICRTLSPGPSWGPIDASKFVDCVCRVALSSEKVQGYFAAGYPMCEALYNHTISDEQIVVLAKTPVWLLHAVTDAIVSPEETAVPTYGTPT